MADSGGATPSLENLVKWENFEEENGKISVNCAEISAGCKAQNNFSERSESISEQQKALKQQGKSSLKKENGGTGTEFRENLEERSKNLKESPGEIINTRGQLDHDLVDAARLAETDTDQASDIALGVHETVSRSDKGEPTASCQSSDLSTVKADGAEGQVNGERVSYLHSSAVAAASDSKGIAADENKITIPTYTSEWTTFEDNQDKNLSSIDEVRKSEETERLPKTSTENHTTAPLKSTTSKMAAFDSRQAATTTDIIPNLSSVTDTEVVKKSSTSFKKTINAANVSNAESGMKSAVAIVENNSAHANSSLIVTQQQQVRETANQGKAELGKQWVSFGEDGNSNASQQKANSGVLATGGLETTNRPLGNGLSQQLSKPDVDNTTNEKKSTAVIPPVSFTSAELDLLASKSWIKFDDSNKTTDNHIQETPSNSAVNASAQSWVTFGDSSAPVGQNLELLVLDVSSKVKTSSTSSPNPFISAATPPLGSNPFKPAATNPFQADTAATAAVSPYPTLNQGLVSSSTTLTGTKTLAISESIPTHITQQEPVVGSSAMVSFVDNGKSKLTITQDQADATPIVMDNQEQKIPKENELVLEEKPVTSGSWSMLLRFPDKKRKIGSREWKPVVIKLEGTTLQIFEEYELSAPFREIPLQAYFVFTDPKLQSFEHGAKVHTVKLEYVKYTEGRSLRHRGTVEHVAQGTPIIKIASPSHTVIGELLESFNNSLRLLPSYRDRGITYRHDEVFLDVDDVTNVLLSGDGTILRKNAKVLIKLRAFLTGDPECQLVLNDVVVREREEARLRGELKPQRVHHWVKLRHCDFHKCVNAATFEQSHAITFHPLDACTFELMRFPVDHHKPLPLLVKAVLKIHSEQRVELKAEIQVCQETKMAKYVRNNVVFRFPIPESWVPLFRTGKAFRGEKSIKSTKGRRAAGIKSRLKHSKCSIGVSLGKAMYEPEYGSVVWRIDHLPFIHSKIPADAPQTLTVILDLPPGMDFPENYKPMAELEYDVAYVLVSDTTVIAVKVSNQNIPDKWVCYRAVYHYDVNIDVSRPSSGPVRDVGCIQQ